MIGLKSKQISKVGTLANLQLGCCGADIHKHSSGRKGVPASAAENPLKTKKTFSFSPVP